MLAQKNWKTPSKVAQKSLFFSSLLPWVAQRTQTEEFMIQNVGYRPTVYKTGVWAGWAVEIMNFLYCSELYGTLFSLDE